MSVWKSPLLYLGIVIILIAGAALFVPYFVDWSGYRSQFEKYASQFTGRKTTVEGEIKVKLFPWPVMSVHDVRIANPVGARQKDLLRADTIEVRMGLAPLLSGKLDIQSIIVDRPVFGLERMATGEGTWAIKPAVDMQALFGADDIEVNGITITNGTIVLGDARRGGEAELNGFNAVLSARSLFGPWRLRGEAVSDDEGVKIALNVGKWHKGEALKFSLQVAPTEDATGLAWAFDGQMADDEKYPVSGKLKISPVVSQKGKSDQQSTFRPVSFRTDIKAGFDTINMSAIEIAPQNSIDVRSFLNGEATVNMGQQIVIDAHIKAARFDLDSVLANDGRRIVVSGEILDLVADYIEGLPANIKIHSDVDLTNLVIAGQTFEGTKADIEINNEHLKFNRLQMLLPGQTDFSFSGTLLPGKSTPQLIGDISLDTISLKDFGKWIWKPHARMIEDIWSGARGKLALKAKLDLSRENIRLFSGKAMLDDVAADLNVNIGFGEKPSVTIGYASDSLDVDRYAPDGVFDKKRDGPLHLALIDFLTSIVEERDISLSLILQQLTMGSMQVKDVIAAVDANENTLEIRKLHIGNLADSKINLSGLMKLKDQGVSGSVKGTIKADDGRKFYKKFIAKELVSADDLEGYLAPLNLSIEGDALARKETTSGKVEIKGKAGRTDLSGKLNFSGKISEWQKANLHVSGKVEDPSGKHLLSLAGLKIENGEDGEAKLAFSATGTIDDGLASTADLDIFGLLSQFSGVVWHENGEEKLSAKGRLAVLSENSSQILAILGVSRPEISPMARVFSGEGSLQVEKGEFALTGIRGTAAATSYSGEIHYKPGNDGDGLKASFSTGQLSLPWLLDALMVDRDGKQHDLSSRFSAYGLGRGKSSLKISAEKMEVWPRFGLGDGKVDILADGRKMNITVSGRGSSDRSVRLEMKTRIGEQLTDLEASLDASLQLGDILRDNNGDQIFVGALRMNGKFKGKGRTPNGIAADLAGKGNIAIMQGQVKNLSPSSFVQLLKKIETPEQVDKLSRDALRKGDLTLGDVKFDFEIKNGVAVSKPVVIKGDGMTGKLRVVYEVANSVADISLRMKLDELKEVPDFEVAYAGKPKGLLASSDLGALKSYLSVEALRKTMQKLEQLQEEQRKLYEEEERIRKEAEAKRKRQEKMKRLLQLKQEELKRKEEEKKKREEEQKARAAAAKLAAAKAAEARRIAAQKAKAAEAKRIAEQKAKAAEAKRIAAQKAKAAKAKPAQSITPRSKPEIDISPLPDIPDAPIELEPFRYNEPPLPLNLFKPVLPRKKIRKPRVRNNWN